MTVKAKDQVTIIDMTDVQSVVVYYLLQLSTLAAPPKPTVASPSGWSQTEPTYSGDDTKTLYTCIKTLYGDGGYEWGTVNVSSTYAAAKSAYNKAQSALLKLEPDALTTTISTALSGSNTITTTKFVMDKNGLLIKNGGLKIQNNAGVTVLSADSSGNLTFKGNLEMQGTQTMRINNPSGNPVGSIYFGSVPSGYEWAPGILSVKGEGLLNLAVSDAVGAKGFGQFIAGGDVVGMFGKEKGRSSFLIGDAGNNILYDSGRYPKLSAIGCTSVSTAFSMASGFRKTTDQNQIVKNALGNFCVLTFAVTGSVAANTHTRLFTLPSGYRPPVSIYASGVGGVYGWFQIRVDPNGNVVVWRSSGMTSMRGNVIYYLN